MTPQDLSNKNDPLGDRMKEYEMVEAGRKPLPGLPLLVRLDGKAFHTFTKGMERPFDLQLQNLMDRTTHALVQETGALVGYVQSDEISLVFFNSRPEAETYLGGRYQKMTSILASMATVAFNRAMRQIFGEDARWALFDARAWQVPSQEEAANAFLWRELDATKNSIAMVAQNFFSHKELQGKNTNQMQEMLFQVHGINWNNYPARCKRGGWFRRLEVSRAFTTDEIDKLPPLHAARKNPDLQVIRSDVQPLEMPPFSRVQNRAAVIFEGASPISAET